MEAPVEREKFFVVVLPEHLVEFLRGYCKSNVQGLEQMARLFPSLDKEKVTNGIALCTELLACLDNPADVV